MKMNSLFKLFKKTKNEIDKSNRKELDNNIELNTLDSKEYLKRGIAKSKLNKYNEAISDINKAIEIDPTDAEAYVERSNIKHKLKDDIGAKNDLNKAKIIIDNLDSGLKAYDEGRYNYNNDNYSQAITNFNKAISLLPSLTCIYYERGLAKKMNGDYKNAMKDFNIAIDSDLTNKADAYYERGLIKYHKLKDSEGALKDYSNAIEINPTESNYYYSKAMILDDKEAVEYLTKALELNSSDAIIYFARALRKSTLKDYVGSIQDINKFIEFNPVGLEATLFDAYMQRASMNTYINDYEAALEDQNIAIKIDSTSTEAYFNRGMSRYFLSAYDEAIIDFTKTIEMDSSNGMAFYYRGMAKLKQKNNEGGNNDISKAKELGYNDYDEEASIKACQEAVDIIREEVERENKINGPKCKEEIENNIKAHTEQLVKALKKTKD
jgi:tetratricopeptide (TPR) repeat protein